MSTIVKVENKVCLELNLTDCEIILECMAPKVQRVNKQTQLFASLQSDGPLTMNQLKKYDKVKKEKIALEDLEMNIITLGNML